MTLEYLDSISSDIAYSQGFEFDNRQEFDAYRREWEHWSELNPEDGFIW